jgi:hypothetical protein
MTIHLTVKGLGFAKEEFVFHWQDNHFDSPPAISVKHLSRFDSFCIQR